MTDLMCPGCGAESHDGLLDKRCTTRLVADLTALPGLLRELEVTLTRQGRAGRGGKTTGPAPLPIDMRASEVADVVRSTLLTWVRELDLGDTKGLADNPRAWCGWLAVRVERIRGHADCAMICDEVKHLLDLVRRTVDSQQDRVFCGQCEACGADLMARPGASTVTCGRCERAGIEGEATVIDVGIRRSEMLGRLERQWATVGQCALLLESFGLPVKASTIHRWATPIERQGVVLPARLQPRGEDSARDRLYRIGDVADLAREDATRRASRSALTEKAQVVV